MFGLLDGIEMQICSDFELKLEVTLTKVGLDNFYIIDQHDIKCIFNVIN